MQNPLVSIIVPAYNAEKYIRQAIDSILNQSYPHIEILLADDASKDNTKKILDAYTDPRIKKYHNPQNLGYLKTCNKLFSLCTGDLIGFQDADDYSLPDRIEKQVAYLTQNPGTGVIGTFYSIVDQYNTPAHYEPYCLTEHNEIKTAFINGERPLIPNSFLVRKEVMSTVGGYSEYFDRIGAEDYYWTWLLMEHTTIHNLPERLYIYRLNENSISGNMSDNPKKHYSNVLVQELIKQRLETASDWISNKESDKINAWMKEKTDAFKANPHIIYFTLARRYFYEKRKKKAISYQLKGLKHQFSWAAFKDLVYFIRH